MSKLNNNLRWVKKGHAQTIGDADTLLPDESTESDTKGQSRKRWQHVRQSLSEPTNTSYPIILKGYNRKRSDSRATKSISIKSLSKCETKIRSFPISNAPDYDLKNITTGGTAEVWRERDHAEKKLVSDKMFTSLHTMANPFLPISIEISRMANHINLDVAEVLCRKRTEIAVSNWMVNKLNRLNGFGGKYAV